MEYRRTFALYLAACFIAANTCPPDCSTLSEMQIKRHRNFTEWSLRDSLTKAFKNVHLRSCRTKKELLPANFLLKDTAESETKMCWTCNMITDSTKNPYKLIFFTIVRIWSQLLTTVTDPVQDNKITTSKLCSWNIPTLHCNWFKTELEDLSRREGGVSWNLISWTRNLWNES